MQCPVFRIQLVREGTLNYKSSINCSRSAESVAAAHLADVDREHFIVIMMTAKNQIIGVNTVHLGSLNFSVVSPREVFKPAILANAAAIIVAHNHPSGDPNPSPEDIAVTRRQMECGTCWTSSFMTTSSSGMGGHSAFERTAT